MRRTVMGIWLACALALTVLSQLFGCRSADPRVTPPYAETPAVYTENRVFYLAPPMGTEGAGKDPARRKLYQPFEIFRMDAMAGTEVPVAASMNSVSHGDPLSIIVHGVRIPDDMSQQLGQTTFDVAVILDIMSGTTASEANSLVVWYQTGVPAGQMLNFRDLLVYYDPAWDSAFAPYFRIRVLDVRALSADTTLTRTLRSVGTLAATFSGIMPTPVMPGVSLAMDAAAQVLQRPQKQVLMDFSVQFYSEEQRRQAGGDLGQLRRGSWIVLGRPESSFATTNALPASPVAGAEPEPPASTINRGPVPSDFWRRSLFVDQQTGQIQDTSGALMNVPYVLVTMSTAHSQVPSIVARRSDELIRLLSTAEGRASTTDLENQSRQLTSSVMTYVAERRLMRNRSVADVESLMSLLSRHLAAQKSPDAVLSDRLSNESERQILLLINRLSPGKSFASAERANAWWSELSEAAKSSLKVVEDPSAPLGFRLMDE